jgi:magnesium chelatase family protein
MIASVAGEIEDGALTDRRPFRAPNHSASMPALVLGGLRAKPGEVSLAHHGVLFRDELPEFQAQALDALRQPLESGEVAIARANHRVTYPARFMLVAAMNPCRCGKANDPGFACRRGPNARCAAEYQNRISGPLLDRIDLTIEVPAVTAADLILPPPAEGSHDIAARVAAARTVQAERYAALGLAGGSPPTPPRLLPCLRRCRGRTPPGFRYCAMPPMPCGCQRAAITACCGWRARSPTSKAPKRSAVCISPRL